MRYFAFGSSLLVTLGLLAACGVDSVDGGSLDDAGPDGGSLGDGGGPKPDSSAPATFAVAGTVSGLKGTGLVLQNNDGDDVAVAKDGSFSFPTKLAAGAAFNVKVKTQPSSPSQTCAVTAGTGTIAGSDVSNVVVSCTTSTFTVGGTVAGLVGSNLVLQINGGETLPVSASGAFEFPTALPSGASYTVTVSGQPTGPVQTCTVGGGTGAVGAGKVTSVAVNCETNKFIIGGTSSGVAGAGVVLQNNAGDDLMVNTNGSFAFATPIEDGAAYAVTIKTQPTNPWQTCTLANGTGTVASSDVTNIGLTCTTNSYKVSATITGLAGTGLVLQNNGGDALTVGADGVFTFATSVPSGEAYNVTVSTQPSGPSQTCTVTSGAGTIAGADVTDVAISCTTNGYNVSGYVSGLVGTVVLTNNGGDDQTISGDGAFLFPSAILSGATYSVAVKTQPSNLTCFVTKFATGTITNAHAKDVFVQCTAGNCRPNGAGDTYCFDWADSLETRAKKACEAHFGTGNCCVIPDGYNGQQYGQCGHGGDDATVHFHYDNHPNGHCSPDYVIGDVVAPGWCGSVTGNFLGGFDVFDVLQSGLQNRQSTRCESVTNHGTTCNNPIIKYGNVDFGVPSDHPNNELDTWCKSLGFSAANGVTYGSRSYTAPAGKLFGCHGYDESAWHWCDWMDGYWYNQSLGYHPGSDGTAITSITCK